MSIFEQPHIRRDKRSQAIDPIVARVEPFLQAALTEVDPRVMTIPEKRLAYAHFAFGAIAELAADQALDETQVLAALVVCLQRTPGLSPEDVSHLVGRCMNSAEQAPNRQAGQMGAQAIRGWQGKNATNVPSPLMALLMPQTQGSPRVLLK